MDGNIDVELFIWGESGVERKTVADVARVLFVNTTTHGEPERITKDEDVDVLFVNTSSPFLLGLTYSERP